MFRDSSPGSLDFEQEALRREIARLREDNEDLRASSNWWLLLYEAALARANAFEDWLSSPEEIQRASLVRYAAWIAERDQEARGEQETPPRAASAHTLVSQTHPPDDAEISRDLIRQ